MANINKISTLMTDRQGYTSYWAVKWASRLNNYGKFPFSINNHGQCPLLVVSCKNKDPNSLFLIFQAFYSSLDLKMFCTLYVILLATSFEWWFHGSTSIERIFLCVIGVPFEDWLCYKRVKIVDKWVMFKKISHEI